MHYNFRRIDREQELGGRLPYEKKFEKTPKGITRSRLEMFFTSKWCQSVTQNIISCHNFFAQYLKSYRESSAAEHFRLTTLLRYQNNFFLNPERYLRHPRPFPTSGRAASNTRGNKMANLFRALQKCKETNVGAKEKKNRNCSAMHD